MPSINDVLPRKIRFDLEDPVYIRKLLECDAPGYIFTASGRRSNLLRVLQLAGKLRKYEFTVYVKDCTVSVKNRKLLFSTPDVNSYTANSFFRILVKYPAIRVDNC